MASVREILGAFLSCVAMGYVCYGEALHAWFVSDDHVLLYGLHDARGGLEALGVREGAPFFRPLLALSFWFDWFVLDADPVLMHGLNVVLHALAGTSLWALARAWTGSTAAAGVTLLAFMTFPLHPEAVTWISARGYPLGGCFVLLALLLAGSGRGPGRLVACAACGFAALCSVEATLPLVCWPFLLAWGTGRARDGGRASAVLALVTVAWF
ncbi:MAG TPA: hypothetical protein VK081_04690, partial [Planctomycetota bacterium]|nr:hypothetical protein [Planctomycetota bacterium]